MDGELISTQLTTEEALRTCELEQPPRGLTLNRIAEITGATQQQVAKDIADLVANHIAYFVRDLDSGTSRIIPLGAPVDNDKLA